MPTAVNGRIPTPGGFEQVTIGPKTWRFSRVNAWVKEEFAFWAQQSAYERLERLKPRLSKVEYARRLQKLDADVNSGAYDWGFALDPNGCGSAIWAARDEGEGPARLAALLLHEHHGDVDLTEVSAAFDQEAREAREQDRPNRIIAALIRCLDPNSVFPSPNETEAGDSQAETTATLPTVGTLTA